MLELKKVNLMLGKPLRRLSYLICYIIAAILEQQEVLKLNNNFYMIKMFI